MRRWLILCSRLEFLFWSVPATFYSWRLLRLSLAGRSLVLGVVDSALGLALVIFFAVPALCWKMLDLHKRSVFDVQRPGFGEWLTAGLVYLAAGALLALVQLWLERGLRLRIGGEGRG